MEDIILFGAGKRLEEVLDLIEIEKVRYICDNDSSKQGEMLYGKRVIGFDELLQLGRQSEIKIVITSSIYEKDMMRQLREAGLDRYVDALYLIQEDVLFKEGDEAYYGARYDDAYTKGIYKREYLKGRVVDAGYRITVCEDSVLPVKAISPDTEIEVDHGGVKYRRCFPDTQYHYLTIKKGEGLHLYADKKIIAGDLIAAGDRARKGKIDLLLIIDSLTQLMLSGEQMGLVMPNTKRFFADGAVFTDCYCAADWTLPGLATIYTGLYPKEHRMLHPRDKELVLTKKTIVSEYKAKGYLTSHFGSNWRGQPSYGYIKDFDRFVYVQGAEKGVAYELIANVLEHIRAFPGRDHFIVLNLFDLHHYQRGIADISVQTDESLQEAFYVDMHTGKSVTKEYDEIKTRLYQREVGRLDFYLQPLYSFLQEYGEGDVSVVLSADHGVSYVRGTGKFLVQLNPSMLRVPLMVRAPGLTPAVYAYNTDNTAIYPILRSLADGALHDEALIRSSKKEAVYNECIYPGEKYCLKILYDGLAIDYESAEEVGEDCVIPQGPGTFQVWSMKEKKQIHEEAVLKQCEEMVKEYITAVC